VTENDEVLFCDRHNHRVRKIDQYGIISTIAGTGNEEFDAQFFHRFFPIQE